jgi:uncharacterized membrane protein
MTMSDLTHSHDHRWRQRAALVLVLVIVLLTTLGFCVAFLAGA